MRDINISGKFAAGRDVNIDQVSIEAPGIPSPGKLSKVRRKLLRKTLPAWLEEDQRLFLPQLRRPLIFPVTGAYGIEAISHPRSKKSQIASPGPEVVYDENSILTAHKRAFGHLLILGDGGSGKTHALHRVMQQMLAEACNDSDEPIPFYLPLSHWDANSGSMWEWCVKEIGSTYSVQRAFLEGWRERGGMALILDGLDELKIRDRRQCVSAINAMLSDWVGMPVIVACRTREYGEIGKQLRLRGNLELSPVTPESVLASVQALGESHAGLSEALMKDRALRSLLQNPLFLTLAITAFEGSEPDQVPHGKSSKERLIERYLEIACSRSGLGESGFGRKTWLPYLAASLRARREVSFYPDRAPVIFLPELLKKPAEKLIKRRVFMVEAIPSMIVRGAVTALAPTSQAQILYAILTLVSPVASSWVAVKFATTDLWIPPASRVTSISRLFLGFMYRLALVFFAESAIANALVEFAPSWETLTGIVVVLFPCGTIWPTLYLMRGSKPDQVDRYPSRPGSELRTLAGTSLAISALAGICIYIGLTISFKSLDPALQPGMLLDPLLNAIFFLPPLMILAGLRNGGSDLIRRRTCVHLMGSFGLLPGSYSRSLESVRKSSLFVPRGGALEFRHSLIRDFLAESSRHGDELGPPILLSRASAEKRA
ncbi:NACHT domain-containing protein [Streptomyces sp. CB03911]|uniref:NACHT domain-containing protein n=1 Tax=Streptomyces sp. CB03911 TaxID=1804758 RepID=UPI0009A0D46B|nr:NACHT domain-containing protein [Streptomyces sp. CB03911]